MEAHCLDTHSDLIRVFSGNRLNISIMRSREREYEFTLPFVSFFLGVSMVERDDNDDYLEYYNLLNVLPCLLRLVAVRARGPPQD